MSTYQVTEDVLLVDVDGDERLVLGSLVLAQLFGRHVNELVEEVQELLVGRLHDLVGRSNGDSERRSST